MATKTKVLMLDIDGVLNKYHSPYDGWAPQIENELVRRLNEILIETGAKIVISSDWRQYIHNGYMTELGFYKMLVSHGMAASAEIIGTTRPKKMSEHGPDFRYMQVRDWLWDHRGEYDKFVILDDMSIKGYPDNFVQTDESKGLTDENVKRAIQILGREKDEQSA